MLIRTVVSPLLGTNCYVVADDAARCLVVDPGAGVVDEVRQVVDESGWTPVAVLVTHGHVDHTWSAAELCGAYGVALHLHEADLPQVADPFGALGPLGGQLAQTAASAGMQYDPAGRVEPFTCAEAGAGAARADLDLGDREAPFAVAALHAPGHTAGSTVYVLEDGTALTGDVLFAGTIGRTDLPGGDGAAMERTLGHLATLPEETVLLPGHGPSSSIGAELRSNPYLRTAR
ncbi:MBL fold metallo-hydrolase [Actinotalea sp. BY-33]|uniref:MBL fold metallo-hydrolase n=1 Tax=Actinotalea soli TaxID=2819234 RepID=A0A939RS85_9CELL|nr:MBL fold metallo-hydrolase [Actinotalea soli]MBO1750472.1 MBL fold metallo-hydrolase [Actinotalea soli]